MFMVRAEDPNSGRSVGIVRSRTQTMEFVFCFSVDPNATYVLFRVVIYGLVLRVPGYRSRGPGLDSQRYQIF
jgi:hypothetical protein